MSSLRIGFGTQIGRPVLIVNANDNLMASSASRVLPMRCRPDLVCVQRTLQGRNYWVVKDPLTLKYFRFEEEEYRLLKMFDGQRSPDVIKQQFDYEFAPQKIEMRELFQLAGMLHRSSLLISDTADQGRELLKRFQTQCKAETRQSLTNIMSVRFRGLDPDRFLDAVTPLTGWLFSWTAFAIVMLIWLSAATLIFAQFEHFLARLPSMDEFFASSNWLWLAVVLAVTKVLHEIGHGVACKRFGGHCHEMGAMLLVFTPCLYMNVSDSWMLESKWKRAGIAAAGMYVELLLASLAVFIWWFSLPGLVNQIALNVIFVCSVSAVIFNANPLLRYDGYYILSDLLEIPNLRAKSTRVLQNFFARLCLGLQPTADPFLPRRHRWLFALYSVAAALYRWVITFSIFWFVYNIFEPWGFKIIGQAIAMMAIYGLIGMPLIQAWRFFSTPGRMTSVKQTRLALSVATIAVILAGIALIPLPHHVYCHFRLVPADAVNIYAKVPGMLVEIYALPNQPVVAGQTIAVLDSDDLGRQIVQMETKVSAASANVQLVKFVSSQGGEGGKGARLAESKAALKTAEGNLRQRRIDQQRLTIKSPASGFMIAPPRVPDKDRDGSSLKEWAGVPLDAANLGAWIKSQTLIGQVVPDLNRFQASLAIDQRDIELVRPDQPVELQLNQMPLKMFHATTIAMDPVRMDETPAALSSRHGGGLQTVVDDQGRDVPESSTYRLKVYLTIKDVAAFSGGTGIAKIKVGHQTIASRAWRLVCHTFNFDL